MFEINSVKFSPVESAPAFVVELKQLSFIDFSEIQMITGEDEPSGGPEIKSKKKDAKKNLEFTKQVLTRGIVSIKGLKINGNEVSDVNEMIKWVQPEVVSKIVAEILKLSTSGDEETKNS